MLWLGLLGCFVTAELYDAKADRDGDGYISDALPGGDDCADERADIHPGAFESCLDSLDSDCDGLLCPERLELALDDTARLVYGSQTDGFLQVSAVLDMDGDGLLEVILSEPGASRYDDRFDDKDENEPVVGRIFVVPLDASGTVDDAAIFTLTAPGRDGLWAHRAGDLDGDGDDELAVSTYGGSHQLWLLDTISADGSVEAAASAVVDAQVDGPDVLEGAGEPQRFGDVQAVGDWDGDGRDDFVLMSPNGDEDDDGYAYLITDTLPASSAVEDAYAVRISGPGRFARLGGEVGDAPDTNGDGQLEILLTAPTANFVDQTTNKQLDPSAGAAFLFVTLSGEEVDSRDADLSILGVYQGAPLLWSSSLGDINGDGYDDLGAHVDSGPGDLLIFFGAASPEEHVLFFEDADIRLFGDGGALTTSGFGASTTAGFDLDGDARGDVLVMAPREGYGGLGDHTNDAGAAYLYYGPISGVLSPDHAAARWSGPVVGGQLGSAVVADLDQDAQLDLLLSAPGAPLPGIDEPGEDDLGYGQIFLLTDFVAELR